MEGRYYYFGESVSQGFKRALFQSKTRRNILSLSATKTSTLLWSYYAAGHTGIAIGIRRPKDVKPSRVVRPVTYDNGVYLDAKALRKAPDQLALEILTQKQIPWGHEQEVRVFSNQTYVRVAITELVLGCNIAISDEALVRQLAKRWHPKIRIAKLRRSSLDEPEAVEPTSH
jgi:hypothetical protein